MKPYVLWKILLVKSTQAIAVLATIWAVWYLTAILLNAVLGGLTNADGDTFNMEYSQILALILVTFAVAVVRLIRLLRRKLDYVVRCMELWSLAR